MSHLLQFNHDTCTEIFVGRFEILPASIISLDIGKKFQTSQFSVATSSSIKIHVHFICTWSLILITIIH